MVKILTPEQQAEVIAMRARRESVKKLAKITAVSTTTIRRVLHGEKPRASRINQEAFKTLQLLYQHKVTFEQLRALLDPVPGVQTHYQVKRSRKSPKAHNGRQAMLFA